MLASGLIAGGMSWWQAVGTILLGNLIETDSHVCSIGIRVGQIWNSVSVFRSRIFGVKVVIYGFSKRALVFWDGSGIQTWIGGQAIYSMFQVISAYGASGISGGYVDLFLRILALNMFVIWRGIETIRFLEGIGAPFMLALGLFLLALVDHRQSRRFRPTRLSHRLQIRRPRPISCTFSFVAHRHGLGFWATVALTEFGLHAIRETAACAKWGTGSGLPAATLYSFIGVAVTSASVLLFGEPIRDPVALLGDSINR